MNKRSLIFLAALAAAGPAAGRAEQSAAEPGRSPFLPPNVANNEGSTSDPNALDLRGIMSTDEGLKYNIYDPAKKSSVWVGVNETGNGFLIKSADPQREQVTLVSNGQQLVLRLKEAKVLAQAANGIPVGGVVLHPTPADEQARLQAVADEVRRRRLLREEAAQRGNGQVPMPGQMGGVSGGGLYRPRNRPQ